MLAAKLYGKEDLRLVECPVPDIQEDEILLRVKAAAVCGTDLRMIQNGSKGIDEQSPRTLGHEISGIIEKKGSMVKGTKWVCISVLPLIWDVVFVIIV